MQKQKTLSERPVHIGFGSLKGGVGKSSIAEILASYLYYREGVNLFVVDCDFSQYSFANLRERDKETVQNGRPALLSRMKKHFEAFGKPAYRILKSTSGQAMQDVQAFMEARSEETFDLVLFDLPGRADDPDLVSLTVDMDYLISPIEPDRQSLVACMSYALAVRDLGVSITSGNIKQIYMLWNKIDRRVHPAVIEFYDREIEKEGLGLFDTRLPRSSRFKKEITIDNREVFRSTYLPPDKSLLEGSGIAALAGEIIEKCLLKTETSCPRLKNNAKS